MIDILMDSSVAPTNHPTVACFPFPLTATLRLSADIRPASQPRVHAGDPCQPRTGALHAYVPGSHWQGQRVACSSICFAKENDENPINRKLDQIVFWSQRTGANSDYRRLHSQTRPRQWCRQTTWMHRRKVCRRPTRLLPRAARRNGRENGWACAQRNQAKSRNSLTSRLRFFAT